MYDLYYVLDASAFINGFELQNPNNFTVSEITEEVKDLKSRLVLNQAIEEERIIITRAKKGTSKPPVINISDFLKPAKLLSGLTTVEAAVDLAYCAFLRGFLLPFLFSPPLPSLSLYITGGVNFSGI